jgi:putative transposase
VSVRELLMFVQLGRIAATVRHRIIRAKGCPSNKTALAMVFKLINGAQKTCHRLNGPQQLPKIIQGVKFSDGLEMSDTNDHQAITAAA